MRPSPLIQLVLAAALLLSAPAARAQKVYLNPSNQTNNAVSGGGNEAQYALINARISEGILDGAGFDSRVDQDFTNAPANANSWGAAIFVSIHTNAGGGHGIETLYKSTGGKTLAGKVQDGLLGKLPFQSRGLKYRDDLHVLNSTNMYACLTEALFHDCSSGSGYAGHPPSESAYLRSSSGQQAIGAGIANGVCSYYNKSCSGTTPVTKGFIRGVVFKNGTLTDHIAGATVKLNTGATVTYDGGAGWAFEVDPGTYTITASAPGYQTNTKTCPAVTSGGTSWCSIELAPEVSSQTGFIKGVVFKNGDSADHVFPATVKTNTGATKTYDGSAVWSFELAPGNYSITASASGYDNNSRDCPAVTAGGTAWCSIELTASAVQPTKGTLKGVVYRDGDPSNHVAPATVTVSSGATTTFTGAGEWSFELTPGTYSVTASAEGFVEATVQCPAAVTAGGTAVCNVELTAEPPDPDPETDAGTEDPADASTPNPKPDAGTVQADGGQVPVAPEVPDSSCGCSSASSGLLGLFALPLMLVRPRRRRG